jgi:hypothetical protein
MLPCLPFHLNTFEAIKLFQQLLCDLEYRQKISFPTYYSDILSENDRKNDFIESQKKSTGLKRLDFVCSFLIFLCDFSLYFFPSMSFCLLLCVSVSLYLCLYGFCLSISLCFLSLSPLH